MREQVTLSLNTMDGAMVEPVECDAFGAAKVAYREQIKVGNPPRSALNLATIVYQQRNPSVSADEARALIARELGLAEH